MFDAVEDVNEFVSATGVFSRLGVMDSQNRVDKETMDDTDREQDANARKYYVRRRKCLKSRY